MHTLSAFPQLEGDVLSMVVIVLCQDIEGHLGKRLLSGH